MAAKRSADLFSLRRLPFSVSPNVGQLVYFCFHENFHEEVSRIISCWTYTQSATSRNQIWMLWPRFSAAECCGLCESPVSTAINMFVFRRPRFALVVAGRMNWFLVDCEIRGMTRSVNYHYVEAEMCVSAKPHSQLNAPLFSFESSSATVMPGLLRKAVDPCVPIGASLCCRCLRKHILRSPEKRIA